MSFSNADENENVSEENQLKLRIAQNQTNAVQRGLGAKFRVGFKRNDNSDVRDLVTAYFIVLNTHRVLKLDGEHTYLWWLDERLDWRMYRPIG